MADHISEYGFVQKNDGTSRRARSKSAPQSQAAWEKPKRITNIGGTNEERFGVTGVDERKDNPWRYLGPVREKHLTPFFKNREKVDAAVKTLLEGDGKKTLDNFRLFKQFLPVVVYRTHPELSIMHDAKITRKQLWRMMARMWLYSEDVVTAFNQIRSQARLQRAIRDLVLVQDRAILGAPVWWLRFALKHGLVDWIPTHARENKPSARVERAEKILASWKMRI